MKNTSEDNTQFYFNRDTMACNSNTETNPPHYHNLCEIYFLQKGSCTSFVDNYSYQLEEGDLLFVPERIIHNTLYPKANIRTRLLVRFTRQYIPSAALPSEYFYRNKEIIGQIQRILETIEQEYFQSDRYSDEVIRCQMKLLFFLMARHPNSSSYKELSNKTISQAVLWLQSHFMEDASLSNVANVVAVSPEHLSRLFKKQTGIGFREYRNLLRLQKAEEMLKQANHLSIARIASECGFADSNYFSVNFKKIYGVSPKSFR